MADEKVGDPTLADAVDDMNFTYDVCMVFKIPAEDADMPITPGPVVVEKLKKAGLRTKLYQSVGHDEIYCLIGASETRLEMEADRVDLDVLLNPSATIELAYEKGVKLAIATKNHDEKATLISEDLWKNLYGKFDRDARKKALYTKYNSDGEFHKNSCFRAVDRINLIVSIIEADENFFGAHLSLSKLKVQKNSHLLAWFPLHEPEKKDLLRRSWLSIAGTLSQPLDEIRDYYGEKIALYFAFLQFYTRMLVIPAIIGVIFGGLQLGRGISERNGTWLFYILLVVWASGFLELWKQQESSMRVKWGMTKFLAKEQPRPEFEGDEVYSPVTGKLEPYFPFLKKLLRTAQSLGVLITLVLMLLGCMGGVFIARFQIQKAKVGGSVGPIILGSVLNVVNIQVWNFIYGKVADRLNAYENHRTDSEFENAKIGKSFVFKFVNSYNALFYLAYFKQLVEGDESGCNLTNDFCLSAVQYQLFIVFGLMIIVNNFFEVFVPYVKQKLKSKSESKGLADGVEKSFPELEYELGDYESTVDDFDELAVQFGFVTLFVIAFPLAPLMALVNNILELNVDSSKLLLLTKRPEPRGAANIGTWFDIFKLLSYIAVLTNIIMVVFYTSEVRYYVGLVTADTEAEFLAMSEQDRLAKQNSALVNAFWVFIVVEHFLYILKFSLEYFIPDDAEWVLNHISRQEYLNDLLINDVPEEGDDFTVGTEGVGPSSKWDLSRVPATLDNDDKHIRF